MTEREWFLLVPGSTWQEVPGTDKQLALALAERYEVLWLEPPTSAKDMLSGRGPRRYLHQVAPGIHRLQTLVPPGATRPGMRALANAMVQRRLSRELAERQVVPVATIVLSARGQFPARLSGRRLLFVTDDWLSGADMMGLSVDAIAAQLDTNLAAADAVAAVTPDLAELLSARSSGLDVAVVPNGTLVSPPVASATRDRIVALVGQLNERLDLDVLEAVADAGIELLVMGPRTERDPAVTARLDQLGRRANVTMTGALPHVELQRRLSGVRVGLTPYADNAFNRSSFPLKTLEYLGSGLPVVSTDLPAARWLDSPDLTIAQSPAEVVALLRRALDQEPDLDAEGARREFVRQNHTWTARRDQITELLQV